MDELSTIKTLNAEVKPLKEGTYTRESTSHNNDMECRVDAPKAPIFKGSVMLRGGELSL